MNVSTLLIAALLPSFFHVSPEAAVTKTYGLHDWRLVVTTDTFTHEATCRLSNNKGFFPTVTAVRSAWAFHFNPALDTSDASFSVNGSPPRKWQELYGDLIHAGSLVEAERLDNATGGMVVIPFSVAGDAKEVVVQPVPRTAPRRFNIGYGAELRAAAFGLGCERFEPAADR